MFLYEFFVWLGTTPPAQWINVSIPAFAFTEAAHLLGLALTVAAILVADLAVLRGLLRDVPARDVVSGLHPVLAVGLLAVTASGLLLVSNAPDKYYVNPLFAPKFVLLLVAVVAHGALAYRVQRSAAPDTAARALASVSLASWAAVAIAGRWLGFV
jgi:hypothetical protein